MSHEEEIFHPGTGKETQMPFGVRSRFWKGVSGRDRRKTARRNPRQKKSSPWHFPHWILFYLGYSRFLTGPRSFEPGLNPHNSSACFLKGCRALKAGISSGAGEQVFWR